MKVVSFLVAMLYVLNSGVVAFAALVTVEPITRSHPNSTPSTVGNGASTAPVLSPDGRIVAFVSDASNLVTNNIVRGPQFSVVNVFVRNLTTGQISLVSVSTDGASSGNGHSIEPAVAANGRRIVFESEASNLAPEDNNNATDVFVRDMVSERTILVSVNRAGTGSGNAVSTEPVITPDGRFVAFVSAASDLVAGDTNGISDVFVRDLESGATTLVSAGAQLGILTQSEYRSGSPAISDDGRYIAFFSTALGLTSDLITAERGHAYVRDISAGTTTWQTRQVTTGFTPQTGTFNPVISASGRYVAYKSFLSPGATGLFWTDRETGVTQRIHYGTGFEGVDFDLQGKPDNFGPILSADGRKVCYVAQGQVYVWDAATDARTLVSVNRFGTTNANAVASSPAMDVAGTRVAFVSAATDLVSNDTHGAAQIYVRDLDTGTTRLASVTERGTGGVGDSMYPALSADGSKLAFQTDSHDLVAGDGNSAADVLVLDLPVGTNWLASARDSRLAIVTAEANSTLHALSVDGRQILFTSLAGNLVTNDNNLNLDVFAADVMTGTIGLVSASPMSSTSASGASFAPIFSTDHRYVAFTSTGTSFSSLATNSVGDVYLRDLQTGAITLISVNVTGDGPGNQLSTALAVSPEGRYVLFSSSAGNLAGGAIGVSGTKLLLRDVNAGLTTLINAGLPVSPGIGNLLISANDRSVAFQTSYGTLYYRAFGSTTNEIIGPFAGALLQTLGPDGRWLSFTRHVTGTGFTLEFFDRQTRQVKLIASGRALTSSATKPPLPPVFSADGRCLIFSDASSTLVANDANNANDIFVVDLDGGPIRLVSLSRSGAGTGNGSSDQPSISGDGRFVAFRSGASDLTDDPAGFGPQIFLRDINTGNTMLISRAPTGTPGTGFSGTPLITPDGQAVIFRSAADNLVNGDFNNATDIFIARISQTVPSGDFRIVAAVPEKDILKLSWAGDSGKTYKIQYKQNLGDAAWTELAATITLQGATASASIPLQQSTQGFYRVLVAP